MTVHITYGTICLSFQQAFVKPSECTWGPSVLGLQASMGPARDDVDLSANATGEPTSTVDIKAM